MKAVVLTEERALELRDVAEPVPGDGDLLLSVEACGICGTDLHAADIGMFLPPVTIGHEFSGVVVGVGKEAEGWSAGDRVAVNPMAILCGHCEACRAGRNNYCQEAVYRRAVGVSRDGGMAEKVVVPASIVHRLPDSVGPTAGAWVEPLAVAVRAVRRSAAQLGDTTLVIGGGPIGLLVLQVLHAIGVRDVTVVEPSAVRREVALKLGATHALSPEDVAQVVSAYDGAFECSGHPSAFQSAIKAVRHGGYVQLVGAATSPVSFESIGLLHKELRVSTSFIYVDEFPIAIDLMARGAVDVSALTTHLIPLVEFGQAFSAMRAPDTAIKALIDVNTNGVAR